MVATQVVSEGSDMSIYEVGFKALNQYNVLQAYDMTVEAAVTKLMWILAKTKGLCPGQGALYTRINDDLLL